MSKGRRGFLSKDDKHYIETFKDKKTPAEIAVHLNRPVTQVQRYLAETVSGSSPKAYSLLDVVRRRPEWKQLQQQFTKDELTFFEYRYLQLLTQFGIDNVTPTEDMQIYQVITLEILTQRVMRQMKNAEEERDRYDKILKQDNISKEEQRRAEDRIDAANKTITACTNKHDGYLLRQNNGLRELKATRDQRIRVVEDSKKSFLGLMKAIQEEEFRSREGREAALVRKAAEKEKERLARPHKFADGFVDQPLNTPETNLEDYEGHE